jgi:hypothetical protein
LPGLNHLCVVDPRDGRPLVGNIERNLTHGLYHLLPDTEQPLLDMAIEWTTRVKAPMPR